MLIFNFNSINKTCAGGGGGGGTINGSIKNDVLGGSGGIVNNGDGCGAICGFVVGNCTLFALCCCWLQWLSWSNNTLFKLFTIDASFGQCVPKKLFTKSILCWVWRANNGAANKFWGCWLGKTNPANDGRLCLWSFGGLKRLSGTLIWPGLALRKFGMLPSKDWIVEEEGRSAGKT